MRQRVTGGWNSGREILGQGHRWRGNWDMYHPIPLLSLLMSQFQPGYGRLAEPCLFQ